MVERIRVEHYIPHDQKDAQKCRPAQLTSLHNHVAQEDHKNLLSVIKEGEEHKVLL